ncbi:MAG: hypothetical protein QN122_02730 [Armatimonadota bacterium]|nr:hypothetical protein [Armatimonadota bacterium]MDR7447694.1 hypothetical protein [Armatimonadota bacterium]MDR7459029.1 hypothetical protein [Armatimonadota bacterium]MDR7480130.1 hypothetical protein [Armatimonadota bacterium]MDR7488893.1 hypothetical protein [Armatimonadota bacterium]
MALDARVDRLEAALAHEAERRQVPLPDLQALLFADVVVRGRLRVRDAEGYLVAEVSAVVDEHDVARAAGVWRVVHGQALPPDSPPS